jgi:DNA helicase-2/ATP-dependent DNA helicase PcrA
MGVSAVPGSGKTWTLSFLASEIIKSNTLSAGQEVLVVTLVNSAVENFSQRISQFLDAEGLIPSLGYRVRTLHGLAHDIVRDRPELAGLDNSFQIIDDREAIRIREDAVYNWLRSHPEGLNDYLISNLSEYKTSELYQRQIPNLLNQIALQFIRSAKNYQLSPADINSNLTAQDQTHPLVGFGLDVYSEYQKNLAYRGAVDFDDLIASAHQILSLDSALLDRLQYKWPYILEDEAQDSSLLQQQILGLLSANEDGQNWVRVGDPNQAIYESFTTADPKLLNEFIQKADYSYTLPNSGRNTLEIIDLANFLVRWCTADHPNRDVRDALYPNQIQPTPPGDSQPNPVGNSDAIHLYNKPLTPDEEIQLIASSVNNWLEKNPQSTAAILAPRNERGKKIAGILRSDYQIEPVELLNSTLATRKTTGALVKIISFIINPTSTKNLSEAFKVYYRDLKADQSAWAEIEHSTELLSSISKPESFLSPGTEKDWLKTSLDLQPIDLHRLESFRTATENWQAAALLPIDQLILTIAGDIFSEPAELNLSHQIAYFERQLSNTHPDWEMPTLLDEMKALARNERRFFPGANGAYFDPSEHRGKVVITTAHKAKGLEWDRVYLISANNYNFPSGAADDRYISEKWFIRDDLNLPAETLAFLNRIRSQDANPPIEGFASKSARLEYIRERLRLLYVSITRAKKELIITWNTGRNGTSEPALAFKVLSDHFHSQKGAAHDQ